MSSRNELLTPEERENASVIYQTLVEAQKLTSEKSVHNVALWMKENINKNPFLNVEYAEIVDEETLQPVSSWKNKNKIMGCVAVHCGKVRLIDNVVLK
jgi:pantoate--beta-alanine ligase